jgi:hypothetical protein
VDALRRKIMTDRTLAEKAAEFYWIHGYWPPQPTLPEFPEFPRECIGMVCGGIGRRSGKPCKSSALYANGRCKWHGGLSTGPKTPEGKARSLANLRRGPRSYRD